MNENDYFDIFDDSWQRVTAGKSGFFDRFYETFLNSSGEIKKMFEKTDPRTQKSLLRQSISYMLEFSTTFKNTKHLESLAQKHSKSQLDINPVHYDLWLSSLINTVKEFDKNYSKDIELAWKVILAPGITYMKHNCY